MYSTANGGWYFPQEREDWANSLRLFSAFHLEWYIDKETNIEEHDYYFTHAIQRERPGGKQKGVNSYRPAKYKKDYDKKGNEILPDTEPTHEEA